MHIEIRKPISTAFFIKSRGKNEDWVSEKGRERRIGEEQE